jgi:hypothetical protein
MRRSAQVAAPLLAAAAFAMTAGCHESRVSYKDEAESTVASVNLRRLAAQEDSTKRGGFGSSFVSDLAVCAVGVGIAFFLIGAGE